MRVFLSNCDNLLTDMCVNLEETTFRVVLTPVPLSSRGDQILEVDSVSLRHAALSEAYAILSECGPGPITLIVSRHPNPKVRPDLLLNKKFSLL